MIGSTMPAAMTPASETTSAFVPPSARASSAMPSAAPTLKVICVVTLKPKLAGTLTGEFNPSSFNFRLNPRFALLMQGRRGPLG